MDVVRDFRTLVEQHQVRTTSDADAIGNIPDGKNPVVLPMDVIQGSINLTRVPPFQSVVDGPIRMVGVHVRCHLLDERVFFLGPGIVEPRVGKPKIPSQFGREKAVEVQARSERHGHGPFVVMFDAANEDHRRGRVLLGNFNGHHPTE